MNKNTIINAVITALCAAMLAACGFVISLGNRVTAIEKDFITDTLFYEKINQLEKRLAVQEVRELQAIKRLAEFASRRRQPENKTTN
ncbi:MAG: hypothetical protein V6Z82_06150 [Flavobacteriales bacterium]